ncbi:DUF2599 domain-containing protein, partial [Pseudomonas rubra]
FMEPLQWVEHYNATKQDYTRQCAFNIKNTQDQLGAQAFYQSIVARNSMPAGQGKFTWNEIIIASWPDEQAGTIPVQSFFYTDETTGLKNAQQDQQDWYKRYGSFVPIVKLTLATDGTGTTTFSYDDSQQAVKAPEETPSSTNCARYIASAEWSRHYDPGTDKEQTTLSVKPTECGRNAQIDQSEAFYKELRSKYAHNAQWTLDQNKDVDASIQRQLVCHFVIARDESVWTLEPFRPYVDHATAVEQKCDPH